MTNLGLPRAPVIAFAIAGAAPGCRRRECDWWCVRSISDGGCEVHPPLCVQHCGNTPTCRDGFQLRPDAGSCAEVEGAFCL